MKKVILFVSIALFGIACNSTKTNEAESSNLNTEIDSVSYSIGVNIGENLNQQLKDANLDLIANGIKDAFDSSTTCLIAGQEAQATIEKYFAKIQANKDVKFKDEGLRYLEENGKRPEVTTLESGLQYEVLIEGIGPKPSSEDKVTTHYHGTLIDGTIFDSSVERGEPASFPVSGVIKGWTEALQLMSVGSKWKLFVPYDLAYGERGVGQKIGPYSTLIFEVELISID